MKKNLKIHLYLCLAFASIWIIGVILDYRQMIPFNETLFAFIGFVLSVSYLLHHIVAGRKN